MGWTNAPEFLNTQSYSALRDRVVLSHMGQQAGVYNDMDYLVATGVGSLFSLSVVFGDALIKATHPTLNNRGFYHVYNDANTNVTIAPPDASNPRIDQVCLVVKDPSFDPALTDSTPALEVVQGTPTPGTNLGTRAGAGTLPPSSLRLADIQVRVGATGIIASDIRDRRPFSRGCFRRTVITSGETATVTTGSPPATISSAATRCEITGDHPVEFVLQAHGYTNNNTAALSYMRVGVSYIANDTLAATYLGSPVNDGGFPLQPQWRQGFTWRYVIAPPANMIGTTVVQPWWNLYESPVVGWQAILAHGGVGGFDPLTMTIRELLHGTNNTFPTS